MSVKGHTTTETTYWCFSEDCYRWETQPHYNSKIVPWGWKRIKKLWYCPKCVKKLEAKKNPTSQEQ